MARPRRLRDDQIIDAAAAAIVARDDGSWSLADVAVRAGMSPAALVKRFGSKTGLLQALTRQWLDGLPQYVAEPDVDPRDVIREWVLAWAGGLSDPSTARGHLALLVHEITAAETRDLVRQGQERQEAFVAEALADADARGLLRAETPRVIAARWLDLLAGAAVRGAINEPAGALARVQHYIFQYLENGTHS
jgi:AcrR family transcriptional regulator